MSRPHISAADDRFVDRREKAASPDSAKQGIPVRSAVVGHFPGSLEWGLCVC